MLIANSNLVGQWATWEHFRELEKRGLMMYGQMTAGSWIYIGSQGIVQGTYETFARPRATHFGGAHLAGKLRAVGRARRHGRRAAARRDDGRRRVPRRRDRSVARAAPARDALSGRGRAGPRRGLARVEARAKAKQARSIAADRQRRRCLRRARAPRRDAGSRHRSDERARSARRLHPAGPIAREPRPSCARRIPRGTSRARAESMAVQVEAMVAMQTRRRARVRLRQQPSRAGGSAAARATRTTSRASCPRTSGRCSARARGRSAGPRCPAIRRYPRHRRDRARRDPRRSDRSRAGWRWRKERVAFQGLPARICWLGYGERASRRPGASTSSCARARSRRRS